MVDIKPDILQMNHSHVTFIFAIEFLLKFKKNVFSYQETLGTKKSVFYQTDRRTYLTIFFKK